MLAQHPGAPRASWLAKLAIGAKLWVQLRDLASVDKVGKMSGDTKINLWPLCARVHTGGKTKSRTRERSEETSLGEQVSLSTFMWPQ